MQYDVSTDLCELATEVKDGMREHTVDVVPFEDLIVPVDVDVLYLHIEHLLPFETTIKQEVHESLSCTFGSPRRGGSVQL